MSENREMGPWIAYVLAGLAVTMVLLVTLLHRVPA